MTATDRIHIIGVGDDGLDGLTAAARTLIEHADLLVGPEAALERIPSGSARRVAIGRDLDAVAENLRAATSLRAVVLATGDPLFYGVARYLCDKLGKDRFEVLPHVSSMQLAFARVKESWEEAYLTDLANHPLERVVEKVRTADKAGLFTTQSATPAVVARALLDRGIDYFSAYVCENLGARDERVTQASLSELAESKFDSLNVLILVRRPDAPDRPADRVGRRLFGNPDEAFLQSQPKQGLLTPAEMRAQALAELDIGPSSVIWDVGAGSGSVAVEAACLAPQGKVFAIEMDPEDHALIQQNAERFQVTNLEAILGKAPEAYADLPDADCIFVGGSGRQVTTLVEDAFRRLKSGGRLAASVGSIENLSAVHQQLRSGGSEVRVWMINIARGAEQMERVRFIALNPAFLIAAVKPS